MAVIINDKSKKETGSHLLCMAGVDYHAGTLPGTSAE